MESAATADGAPFRSSSRIPMTVVANAATGKLMARILLMAGVQVDEERRVERHPSFIVALYFSRA